jgi:hypothetical protein
MTPLTVWLASYPKSGNTWVRAVVTALGTHEHLFAVNHLGSGAQPNHVGASLAVWGLDSRWLDYDENDQVRTALINTWGIAADDDPAASKEPSVRKTHEIYRSGLAGREPFPVAASRAAILVVRDPRDVACSYAPFFGVTIDEAIDAIGTERSAGKGRPAHCETAQPWGSWSSHALSWLDESVPFPVHLVTYEDLKADIVGTLKPVFAAVGLEAGHEKVAAAVELARFERLRESEQQVGFRETSPKTRTFFRSGRSGGWRDELTPEQVLAIEADHAEVMELLGYELTTDASARRAAFEVRESRRRTKAKPWTQLPEHLGLTVVEGEVPEEIPGTQRPRKWIQANERVAAVRFAGGAAVMVEDGKDVTVHWAPGPDEADLDASWLVQGWAVTLASLQRGNLSLHAATVDIDGEIVAIAGRRGAGKSTTAMGLRARGHRLLIDDVTLVEFRDDGSAWTTPYARNVHLLPDSAAAVGIDFDALPLLAGGRTKVAFRAEEPDVVPMRIDRVVVLSPSAHVEAVELSDVQGAARVPLLANNLSRDGIAPIVLGQARYFSLLARLANAAPVQLVTRPAQDWSLDDVLDAIEAAVVRTAAGG